MSLWKECSRLEQIWLAFFTVTYLLLFATGILNGLALAIALSGSFCIFFAAKAKLATFYCGMAYYLLYALHCHVVNNDLIAYLHLLFHLPLQLIGIHIWQKHRIGHPTLQENILLKQLFTQGWIAVLLTLMLIALFVAQIAYSLGSGLPNLLIIVFTFSIIANILMVARFIEAWIAWIAVDVFNLTYWASSTQASVPTYTSGFMMSLFVINSIYGCYRWNKIGKLQNEMYLGPYCLLKLPPTNMKKTHFVFSKHASR